MTTPWFYPNAVTQYGEIPQHVSWQGEENNWAYLRTTDAYVSTTRELLHIANNSVNDLKMKTYYLYLTDFGIVDLPDPITGIEVEVNMKRGGRITDDTIQLRYNDEFIGDNRADYKLDNVKVYGAPDDLWDISNLTANMLTDPSFGLGLRFQSHPSWPHKEHPMLNFIRLRVW
jgi:hypothetical protein